MANVGTRRIRNGASPRNTRFGEFWFGRLLSLVAVFFIVFSTVAAFTAGVRGTDVVHLLRDGFWALLALALIYNGRAAVHDRLADAIRAMREKS